MEEPYISTTVPLTEAVQMVTSEPTPPVYVPPARKKFPILLTLAIILLAFVAAIAVYLFVQVRELNTQLTATPTPLPTPVASVNPMADWKTYFDVNITFNYPSDWIEDTKALSYMNESVAIISPNRSVLRVVPLKTKVKTISEFLVQMDKKNSTAWEGKASVIVKETKKTIISDLNAIRRIEIMGPSGFYTYSTYFKNNNNIFQLILQPTESEIPTEEDIETFDQILSTFKFTETPKLGEECAGPENILCGEGLACKLSVVGDTTKGGICVNESEVNP